jgi:cobalt-precorrin-5B (C1)-methyltransferase
VRRVTLAGMIGKFSKLARGHFMTHVAGNQVDIGFLADLARGCGASPDVEAEMRAANTARHVQEIAQAHQLTALFATVADLVRERSQALVGDALKVDCLLFEPDGTLLGRAGASE